MITYRILNQRKLPWCSLEDLVIESNEGKERYMIRKENLGLKTKVRIIPDKEVLHEIAIEYNPFLRSLFLGSMRIYVNGKYEGKLRRQYPIYSGLAIECTKVPHKVVGSIDAHNGIHVQDINGIKNFRYVFNPENKVTSPITVAEFFVNEIGEKQFFIGLAIALLLTPRDTVTP